MPAVIAIASAPQKVTRLAAFSRFAPPILAPTTPSSKTEQRRDRDHHNHEADRRRKRHQQRESRADRECCCRRQSCLNRPCRGCCRDPQLIAGMGTERIVFHQLLSDLPRQRRGQTAFDIDCLQLSQFALAIVTQLLPFARDIRLLGIGLRADRDIFAAIDIAPATSPATPAIRTLLCVPCAVATPMIRLEVERRPSLAPRTAALSQPRRSTTCRYECRGRRAISVPYP